jgi:hypothetical protein
MLKKASGEILAAIAKDAREYWRTHPEKKAPEKIPTTGMRVCAVIERHAERAQRSVYSLLGDAGVHHEVYARWRRGETNPTLATVEKFEAIGVKVFA